MGHNEVPERAQAMLDYWFGPLGDPERGQHRQIWFKSTAEHDDRLRDLFLADYERAASGALEAWEAAPESALALLLLLDPAARAAADRAMARGFDAALPPAWRKFFYMPFHHSEDLADQRRARMLAESLPRDRDDRDPERGGLRRYGRPYVEVIERFGRFPHRNAILGRASTPAEIEFMEAARASS